MSCTLINPNLVVQKNDKFTTGIVYMPISLAYASSALEKINIKHDVIDLFGNLPNKYKKKENFLIVGEQINKYSFGKDNKCFFVYANQVINHVAVIEIIKNLKKKYPDTPVIVIENTQAVTAYSLKKISSEFFNIGCDYLLTGENEFSIGEIYNLISSKKSLKNIKGLIGKEFSNSKDIIDDLDELMFPNWKKFPIKNYWSLGHAHGPLSSKKYLPILTSRGCPYPCKFCIVPELNNRKWRYRSAKNIVDEIEYYQKKYSVNEFHIEDLNPTVNDKRTREICNEIINRNIVINWKICAGTKIESIKNEETVELMYKSGCRYISISPESGSKKVMKDIDKPFNLKHANKIIKKMNDKNIYSQACFVLGYINENKQDLADTKKLIFDLTKNGVDEIAIFIITPIPGSEIFDNFKGFNNLSELTFSPLWRKDYKKLNFTRLKFYIYFLFWKSIFHPKKVFYQILRFFSKKFYTKMEMIPYKFLKNTFFLIEQK
jgi:anaerobic magnesium-protoporphyrin IX monomethyl ester cyclase